MRYNDTANDRIFDPADAAFVADPYPLFKHLREHDPLHRGATGAWVLSRYDDISAALIDERLGNAASEYATVNRRNRERYVCAQVANNILPFIDPPEHRGPRELISRSFRQTFKSLPLDMEQNAQALLARLPASGEVDLLKAFATPYAAGNICRLLALDEKQIPNLLEWSHWFFYLLTLIPSQQVRIQLDLALQDFRAFFGNTIAARKLRPGDDYISQLLLANRAGEQLDDMQIIDNLMLLFADGIGNVDRGLCNAIALLLQHPEQYQLLVDNPELLPQAVDECLRFESPAQFIGRVARQELVLRGQKIRANEAVLLLLGSANRDASRFADADRFDITRNPNPHLSFGRSRHACIGAPMVRQEIQAALKSVLALIAKIELCDPEQDWEARVGHRWLRALRVRFRAPS